MRCFGNKFKETHPPGPAYAGRVLPSVLHTGHLAHLTLLLCPALDCRWLIMRLTQRVCWSLRYSDTAMTGYFFFLSSSGYNHVTRTPGHMRVLQNVGLKIVRIFVPGGTRNTNTPHVIPENHLAGKIKPECCDDDLVGMHKEEFFT